MKLLFDQNLSWKLVSHLADLFPDSDQVRMLEMDRAEDRDIWVHARDNDFVIVTQDADFYDLSSLFGAPPKVIWLKRGNRPTSATERLLRNNADHLLAFARDPDMGCFELY